MTEINTELLKISFTPYELTEKLLDSYRDGVTTGIQIQGKDYIKVIECLNQIRKLNKNKKIEEVIKNIFEELAI